VNKFSVDLDVIARARLCTEVAAHLTIDGHATRRYQLIAMSPRPNAGSGEKTVQAHGLRQTCDQ